VLKKEVRREERWFAIALPGCFDPFGLRLISGMDADGCGTPAVAAFNAGFELFFRIGFRSSTGFCKIFFCGFAEFRCGPIGGEKALLDPGTLGGS
jgi:hypothetical protein